MIDHNPAESVRDDRSWSTFYTGYIMAVSVMAVSTTYMLAASGVGLGTRSAGFSLILAAFLSFSFFGYIFKARRSAPAAGLPSDDIIERVLFELEEANELVAGSLEIADAFRLVANRVGDLIPHRCSILLLLDETRSRLTTAAVQGECPASLNARSLDHTQGLPGRCFSTGDVVIARRAETVSDALLSGRQNTFGASAAIPLFRGSEVIGVVQLFFPPGTRIASGMASLLEAVGTRISPIIASSMILERNRSRALTDPVTNLPNERSFHLELENRIAEIQRKITDRPLAVLAIDFESPDRSHIGHDALNHVASVARNNLRQMDFFARSREDEFLAVLPTASECLTREIIERIESAFAAEPSSVADRNINIGWAVYGSDGVTAHALLSRARLRKENSGPGKVLLFRNGTTD